jgi:acetyl/propionyl-CoA carboxylase alpha subunit
VSAEARLRLAGEEIAVRLAPDGASVTLGGATLPLARVAYDAPGPGVDAVVFELDGRPYRAVVVRRRNEVLVALAGRTYAFATGAADGGGGAAGRAGSEMVVAPMPGKVVSVLVAPGDVVEIGQPLVVLEAMKMENTLVAEVAGTVRTVAVAAGAMVEAGTVVVEVTAAAPDA